MSGFAGVVSTDGAPPNEDLLKKMAARLAFRGPDGTHIWKQPGAGFVFTFLRTGPAPQCPSQPCSLDGRVWLLGDVRLDGRDDLRLKLEQHGEELEPDVTDEELVLRVWRRWGEQGLPELLGDYAFALWDADARQLWCVRDLMGARPFFCANVGGRLYFSNTLNALRCAREISSELDLHFIGDFLLEGWCPDPSRTVFRDVARLSPGHVLIYSGDHVEARRISSFAIEEPLRLRRQHEYVDSFKELLEKAVHDRLPRGPVTVLMSGGLDSTSVAAIAVAVAQKNKRNLDLRAHTVDYRPLFDDQEALFARRAAEHIQIPIDFQAAGHCGPYEGWNGLAESFPEPLHEPLFLLYRQQMQRIAEHSRVTLTGYGGDGSLTGQAWPFLVHQVRQLRFGSLCRIFGGYILQHGRIPPLRGGFRSGLNRWLGKGPKGPEYPPWLASDFEAKATLRERWNELHQDEKQLHPWYPVSYNVLNSAFWPSIREGEDAAWSAVPLDSRAPFLDLRIQRFLLRVPPVPLCLDKELLRRAVKGLLPEDVRVRPKSPLADDPMAVQAARTDWNSRSSSLLNSVRAFVDLKRLRAVLRGSDFSSWRDLAPISLLYWLECIEGKYGLSL